MTLLSACGDTEIPTGPLRPIADVPTDELVTLFEASDVAEDTSGFGVLSAVPLPDGTALVSWDPHQPTGGDDREPFSDPRLAVLGEGGRLDPIPWPTVDGRPVGADAQLLTAGPDGTAYLAEYMRDLASDGTHARILARDMAGNWRVVPVDPEVEFGFPRVAVGSDGSLYICDDTTIQRIGTDGSVSTVADVQPDNRNSDAPPVLVLQLPVPAFSVTLPAPQGIAIGPDETVYVSTRTDVLAIDPGGTVRLVTSLADMLAEVGAPDMVGDGVPPRPGALGIDADGALLVSDFAQQRIVRVTEQGSTVVEVRAILGSNGINASFSPHDDLLVKLGQWDELAAYGR